MEEPKRRESELDTRQTCRAYFLAILLARLRDLDYILFVQPIRRTRKANMATQTRTALDSNIVAQTLVNTYGVSGLAADPVHIEWAVDHALKTHAPAAVKTALSRLNSKRVAMGKMPSYPRYGHPLF